MRTLAVATVLMLTIFPLAGATGGPIVGGPLGSVEDTVTEATNSDEPCGAGVIPLVWCVVYDAYAFASETSTNAQREALRDVGIVTGAVKGPACDILYGDPNSPNCPLTTTPELSPLVL